MKREEKFLIVIVCFAILNACVGNQSNHIKEAGWLIGTWENKAQSGSIYETWKKTSESEFSGISYTIEQNDSVVFENIRLIQEKDSLFYVPTVINQNDGLPIRFGAKSISDMELVFENLQHDFPQIISYTRINSDSLVAEIKGVSNGKERRLVFPMKRLK